jgi:hypothetical protein
MCKNLSSSFVENTICKKEKEKEEKKMQHEVQRLFFPPKRR